MSVWWSARVSGLLGILLWAGAAWGQVESDLVVSKLGPKVAAADSDVTYQLVVHNLGPGDITSGNLIDTLPVGTTFGALTQTTGSTVSCTTPAPTQPGSIDCDLDGMAAGASAAFELMVHLDATLMPGTPVTNQVTATGGFLDTNDENNQATSTLFISSTTTDMAIDKSGPTYAIPGSDITYVITVANAGAQEAQSVSWTDALPGDLTFVSLTQDSGTSYTCTTPAAGVGGTISCSAASVASGDGATWTLVAQPPPTTPSGTQYVNTAVVTSAQDGNNENNASSQGTTLSAADLAVAISAPSQALAGDDLVLTVDISIAGPDAALLVEWLLPLPAGTHLSSIQQNAGPSSTCGELAGNAHCRIGLLGVGASANFTLNLTVDTSATNGSMLVFLATTTADGADPNTANNSASATSSVVGAADVAITKTANGPANAGAELDYRIEVRNLGFQNATTVSWHDSLPVTTTFSSLVQDSGPTFSCTTPAIGSGGDVDCSVASLLPGAIAQFTLTVSVSTSAGHGSSLSNTADAASDVDADTGSNAATASSTIVGLADLRISKTAPLSVTIGQAIDYQIVLDNIGFQPAANAIWLDTLPAGLRFISLNQTNGPTMACTTPAALTEGTVECQIASLAPGVSAQFTLRVDTGAALPGDIANTAEARGSNSEPATNNNSAAAVVAVSALPPNTPIPMLEPWQLTLLAALLVGVAAHHHRYPRTPV